MTPGRVFSRGLFRQDATCGAQTLLRHSHSAQSVQIFVCMYVCSFMLQESHACHPKTGARLALLREGVAVLMA